MPSPLIFTDGFDVYGPPGATPNILTQWTSQLGGSGTLVAGLSSTGYAYRIGTAATITKNLGVSLTRIAGSVRFSVPQAGGGNNFVFQSNLGTAAFSITIELSGVINIRTGNAGGAIITGGGSIAANSTHVLSWDVTLGGAGVGLYTVNLDGTLLYSGTGNTNNAQANVTIINAASISGTGNFFTLDDLIVLDPTQPAYNSALLTSNPVIETQFVNGDNQTQFANDGDIVLPAGISPNGVARANAATNAPGANFIYLVRFTADITRTLNSISVVPGATSATVKSKAVLYADSSGSIGSLLSSGNEVVGCTSGSTLTGTLVTPQTVTAGQSYWMGLITDTSVVLQQYDATTNLGQKKANTYTSGAPAGPLSGMTTGQPTWLIWGNCTGSAANWAAVGRNPPLGTAASQTHSSTVGQEDLFTFPALSTNPSTIFGMAVKGFVSKSDAGARTASFNVKSAATDTTGSSPSQGLATTSQWQASYFDTDPATGVAWTLSGANAAKGGVSVAS